MFLLFLASTAGWCHAGRINFDPFDKQTSDDSILGRSRWPPMAEETFPPGSCSTSPDTVTIEAEAATSRTTFPATFPPLPSVLRPFPTFGFSSSDGSDAVTFPPETSSPTGMVGPLVTPPPFGSSESITTMAGSITCDCLPAQLCLNHTTYSVITTRIVTRPPAETVCPPGQVYCCVRTTKLGCGIANVVPGVSPKDGQARLGQNPWTAIILDSGNAYVGGGALIDSRHVLTVAHRMIGFSESGLKVRLGEWDISSESEPVGHLEVRVKKLVNHPKFESVTLKNDISLITLEAPVSTLTTPYPHVNTICLPDSRMTFSNSRCRVAGWGKDRFDGSYQKIIKEVEVPVLFDEDCQRKLRNTKLGSSFALDRNSFICAGGEAGMDACTGDGGNALACMRDGKFFVAGLTAGGIECGNENVPGLYVNIANYVSWINNMIAAEDAMVWLDPRRKHR